MKKTLATLGLLLIFIGLFMMKKDEINALINKYFKGNNIVTLGERMNIIETMILILFRILIILVLIIIKIY